MAGVLLASTVLPLALIGLSRRSARLAVAVGAAAAGLILASGLMPHIDFAPWPSVFGGLYGASLLPLLVEVARDEVQRRDQEQP